MTRPGPGTLGGPAVELNGVSLRYDTADKVLADINVRLKSGTFTFLTGPSGAGKSSLLKLLYLAHAPTSGQVRLFGQQTTDMPRKQLSALRRRIGVVFQDFRLLEHLTAFENVALPLRVLGQKEETYGEEVVDLVRWVGLGDRVHARPSAMSGGEQQRLASARALINKPDLLIADEPTGNVDPDMARRIFRLFIELNRRLNTTVIIATHDMHIISEFNAPVLKLQDGMLMSEPARQRS